MEWIFRCVLGALCWICVVFGKEGEGGKGEGRGGVGWSVRGRERLRSWFEFVVCGGFFGCLRCGEAEDRWEVVLCLIPLELVVCV